MKPNRDPQFFGERSRLLNLEEAFHDLAIFLGLAIFVVTGALIYAQVKDNGIDPQTPGDLFLMMLGGLTLMNVGVFFLIRRYRSSWLKIERESGTDKVTGAMNRTHFEKLLEEELRRGGRYHYPITVCYLDIDDFGAYNEQNGRKDGDQLLKKVSDLLRGAVRFADCVARYHHDEFCILLPHTDIVRAEKFMTRLTAGISEHLDIGFSAGVTSYQAGENKAQFLMRAIASLTQAKREGKKKIRYSVSDSPAGIQLP